MAVDAPRPPVGGIAWIASPSPVTLRGVQSAIGPDGFAARNLNAATRSRSEADTCSVSQGDHRVSNAPACWTRSPADVCRVPLRLSLRLIVPQIRAGPPVKAATVGSVAAREGGL